MLEIKPLGDYSTVYNSRILQEPLASGTGGNIPLYESVKGGSKRTRIRKTRKTRKTRKGRRTMCRKNQRK